MFPVMEQMPHILVVDDDREIRDLLSRFLEKAGHARHRRARRAGGPPRLALGRYHLVVLDLMMPGERARIRALAAHPVRRADRHADRDGRGDRPHRRPGTRRRRLRRQALQPARIAGPHPRRAAPRGDGTGRAKEPPAKAIRFAGWTLEPARRRLLNPDGAEVPLTGGEYESAARCWSERPNRVLTRDMLMDLLRGRQAGPFDRAIDVAVVPPAPQAGG